MKATFHDIPHIQNFIIHNIRALRIQDAFEKGGL